MSNYIPIEFLKDTAKAINVLSVIDSISHIVPREDPTAIMSNKNKRKLTRYNVHSLEKNFTEDSFEEELLKYYRTEYYQKHINGARLSYAKYYKNKNAMLNRMNKLDKSIEGVGMDGGGSYPTTYSKERDGITNIEKDADKVNKWPTTGSEEQTEILKQSIKGIVGWQSSNFSQLSIGTPVQVASAAIYLTEIEKLNQIPPHAYKSSIFGNEFIKKRPECNGLKYLLDGNKIDLEKSAYNGIREFEKKSFRRFFEAIPITGVVGHHFIVFKAGLGRCEILPNAAVAAPIIGAPGTTTKEQTTFHSTYIASAQNQNSLFYTDNAAGPTVATKGLSQGLINVFLDNPPDNSFLMKSRYGSIMLLYSIFHLYAVYIYRLYEEMINNTTIDMNDETKKKYEKSNQLMYTNFLNLINYAISKHFKIPVQDSEIKDLIIVTNEEDVNPAVTAGALAAESASTRHGVTTMYPDHGVRVLNLKHNPENINQAKRYISLSGLIGTIYIGFKKTELYYNSFIKDKEPFSRENYPIVFSNYDTCDSIDYRATLERLTKFLLVTNEMEHPKIDNEIIAVGAPLQNTEIIEYTAEALDGYYTVVAESKAIYMSYMDLKLNVFKSGISTKMVVDIRNDLLSNFGLLSSTITQQELKNLKCLKLAKDIISKYRRYRKEELKLTDDKTIYTSKNKLLNGSKIGDYVYEQTRATKRLKAGTRAIIYLEVAKLTYQLFMNRNPGLTLCPIFLDTLNKDSKEIDDELTDELRKMISRKTLNITNRYGENSLQKLSSSVHLIRLSDIPRTPSSYLSSISSLYSSIGRVSSVSSLSSSYLSMGMEKSLLTKEQSLRVSSVQFWKDLKVAFNGKTVFLPVSYSSSGVGVSYRFNDSNFMLIDVINSMIFSKLIFQRLFPLTAKTIYDKLQKRGYLMVTAQTIDLSNADNWRAIDNTFFTRLRIHTKLRNIIHSRSVFYNLISNTAYLANKQNLTIPSTSETSKSLTKYCSNYLKKDLKNCNILISREQFAQTIESRMDMLESTRGIDIRSGRSYFEYASISSPDLIQR